ncbi:MAG TPA: hypothetical protein VK975_03350 [Acidimicrobiales bacterium]|nr:hypothetical protein [Acidimicrobiales bacterium]
MGATLVLAPSVTSVWAGPSARQPGVTLITRAAGIRDLVVGWRTLQAFAAGAPVRRPLIDGAVADAVDLGAVVLVWPRLPARARVAIAVAAASAVGLGVWLASVLD